MKRLDLRPAALPGAARFCPRSPGGFTLIELLVTITVIGILAAILLPAIRIGLRSSRSQASRAIIAQMGIAIQQFYSEKDRYPVDNAPGANITSESLIMELGEGRLSVKKTFVDDLDGNSHRELYDGWGLPIVYNRSNPLHNVNTYDLFSAGFYALDIPQLADPPKTGAGLQAFETAALQRQGAEYQYDHYSVRSNKTNEFLGNW